MSRRTVDVGPARRCGNGKVLQVMTEKETATVGFMSEPRTSPQPLWFHLRADGVAGRRMRFVWQNADGCLGLGSREHLENVRPVASADGGGWQRIATTEVVERPEGGHILQFDAPPAEDTLSVAFCYPYGPEDLHRTFRELRSVWECDAIGLTGAGRQLLRLRRPAPERERCAPGVYVTARQHAGETPGSWVLDGLLREVAETEGAPGDGEALDWWVMPFVDLDGAVSGDYGKDALPCDFNRAWAAMPMRPEVQAIQQDMRRFAARVGPRFALDLHAPGGGETTFYHFHPREDRPEAQRKVGQAFTPFLKEQFPELEEVSRVPRYASRWDTNETLTGWVWDHLKETPGISIETPYQHLGEGKWLEPDDYREIGRRVARAAAGFVRSCE